MSPAQNNKVNTYFLPKECRQQLSDYIIIFLFCFDSVSTAAIIKPVTVELLMKTHTSYQATSRSLATRYHDNCTGRSGQQDEEQEEEQQLNCCKDLQQSFHLFSYNICIHTNTNQDLKQNSKIPLIQPIRFQCGVTWFLPSSQLMVASSSPFTVD